MELSDGQVALAAAVAGAEVVRRSFRTPVAQHAKEGTDFATDADLDSESVIRRLLGRHRPDDAQLGEEGGSSGSPTSARRWLVDPLCGTRNFAAGSAQFATNVALVDDGRIVAAAVADPITQETWWTDGAASRLRLGEGDCAVAPAADSALVDLNVDGTLLQRRLTIELLGVTAFRERFQPRVVSSSLALAWVAAGRRAAYVTEGDLTDSVHFAAGIGVCAAAGVVLSDLDGNRLGRPPTFPTAGRGLVAAADEATLEELVGLVGQLG